MPRKKRDGGAHFYVSDERREQLKDLCWRHRISFQEMLRDAVNEFWDRKLAEEPQPNAVACPGCYSAFPVAGSGEVAGLAVPRFRDEDSVLMLIPHRLLVYVSKLIDIMTFGGVPEELITIATSAIQFTWTQLPVREE